MSEREMYLAFNEKTGMFETLRKIEIFTTDKDPEPEDLETIIVSKGALKVRTGRFVIYDVDYLKTHIDQEAELYGRHDGKKKELDGCENCRFENKEGYEEPCWSCSHNHTDNWRAKE